MNWIALSVNIPSELVQATTQIMSHYGQGGAVVYENINELGRSDLFTVTAYLPSDRSTTKAKKLILDGFSQARLPLHLVLGEKALKKEDWLDSLKDHFKVLEVGRRFLIKPTWVVQDVPASERLLIELDPGEAFGTGWHATTHLCLLSLEKYLSPGMSVLDLGTGTGILAVAAAKLGAASVLALDTDPAAVEVARSNAVLNRVADRIKVRRGTLSSGVEVRHLNEFDLVLANITAKAIGNFSETFSRVMKIGGRLIVSGINAQGLDEVLIKLALADFNLDDLTCESEWRAVIATKAHSTV
jgi:ribosomal protein L11 methyltransferase